MREDVAEEHHFGYASQHHNENRVDEKYSGMLV